VRNKRLLNAVLVNGLLLVICIIWILPTFGLLVTSFRDRDVVSRTGWWTVFTRPSQAKLTLEIYRQVLSGKTVTIVDARGQRQTVRGDNLSRAFVNSLTVTIPTVVIPVLIAAFAAYGFAWMAFPGRKLFFIIVIGLLVVPLQISLIPLLRDYGRLELTGTFLAVWLAHTGFGLPLSVYLMYNFISQLPRSVIESAIIDGCSHFGVFWKLVLPLFIPAVASLVIFQFLWVWNDMLVALVFIGSKPGMEVLTQRLLYLIGSRGQDWHLLCAGAFVSMVLPLGVFLALQRYLVRGLLAGSVKG
jgi:alpha-glucoside transport system permease protein